MKIAELTAAREVTISEREKPLLVNDDDALVRITACGICGTDLHYFRNGRLGSHPIPLPLPLGHESAGVVEEVTDGLGFEVGDRVAIDSSNPCRECRYCKLGLYNHCLNDKFMGSSNALSSPGAFREYVVVRTTQLHKLDDWMSDEVGGLVEPLGIALQAVHRANLTLTDNVIVLGAGSIGLYTALLARICGAQSVCIGDTLRYRAEFANIRLGFESAWLGGEKVVNNVSGQFTVVFDAAGTQQAIEWALRLASPMARIVHIGMPEQDHLQINPHLIRIKELAILGVRRSNNRYEECLALIRRGFPIDEVVTHRFPLDDIQRAFEIAAGYEDGIIKGVITP